jgi:Putative binding domain, N-terminal/Viral BACON domain
MRHRAAERALVVGILLASAAGCGSSATTSVGPSEFLRCSVEATASPAAFPPDGGNGRLTVSTDRDCSWTASSSANWIQLASTSGQGGATVEFTVASNGDPAARSASFSVGNQQVAVTQQPAPCRFQLSATGGNLPSAGGSMTIEVTASSALCEWRARADADWIVIREGGTGRGTGRVVVEAGPSGGPSRSGTLVVADVPVTITQGDGCSYAIAPLNQSIGASGGSGTVSVTAGQGCAWNAVSQASWIAITAGASGAGSGAVMFAVAPHSGPPRIGTMMVAGHTFSITQQSGCSITLGAGTQTFPAAGGQGSVRVDSSGGCQWQALSNAGWITIQSGASGTGGGEVRFQVAANTSGARNGTLTIGGQTFTVNQGPACSFALSANSANVPNSGGTGVVDVVAAAGCTWTATPDPTAPWLRITAGANGNGNGRVEFVADPNPGGTRSARLTIGDKTFTVDQGAACSFALSANSANVPNSGGSGAVDVIAPAGCAWAAASDPSVTWVRITAGANGTGNGRVEFAVDPNAGPARSTSLTIAGLPFSIQQEANCSYTIAPPGQMFDVAGGSGTIAVTTNGGCPWSASSPVDWITITPPGGGSGSGSVTFTVTANNGPARNATLMVAGQPFSVTQMGTMLVLESLVVRDIPYVPIVQRPRT